VTVRRDAQGRATRVEAVYGEKAGEVKSVRRSEASAGAAVVVLTLTDGTSIEMAPDVPVTMAGRAVSFADIRPGERVVVRVNPQTGRGIGVAVVTADEPAPAPPARAEVTSVDVAVGGGPQPIPARRRRAFGDAAGDAGRHGVVLDPRRRGRAERRPRGNRRRHRDLRGNVRHPEGDQRARGDAGRRRSGSAKPRPRWRRPASRS
jgi:hypothetical protein